MGKNVLEGVHVFDFEIVDFIKIAGLSVTGAAKVFGVSRTTIQNWKGGEKIPKHVLMACQAYALAEAEQARDDVLKRYGAIMMGHPSSRS